MALTSSFELPVTETAEGCVTVTSYDSTALGVTLVTIGILFAGGTFVFPPGHSLFLVLWFLLPGLVMIAAGIVLLSRRTRLTFDPANRQATWRKSSLIRSAEMCVSYDQLRFAIVPASLGLGWDGYALWVMVVGHSTGGEGREPPRVLKRLVLTQRTRLNRVLVWAEKLGHRTGLPLSHLVDINGQEITSTQ